MSISVERKKRNSNDNWLKSCAESTRGEIAIRHTNFSLVVVTLNHRFPSIVSIQFSAALWEVFRLELNTQQVAVMISCAQETKWISSLSNLSFRSVSCNAIRQGEFCCWSISCARVSATAPWRDSSTWIEKNVCLTTKKSNDTHWAHFSRSADLERCETCKIFSQLSWEASTAGRGRPCRVRTDE